MKTKQLTIYAMLIALTVALSLTILIPVPATNGFVTLCEAGIYTAAFLYGPTGGLVVGASSGLLIDLISGYPQWAVFSLVIHGLQGYVAGSFSKSSTRMWGLGLLLGSLVKVNIGKNTNKMIQLLEPPKNKVSSLINELQSFTNVHIKNNIKDWITYNCLQEHQTIQRQISV